MGQASPAAVAQVEQWQLHCLGELVARRDVRQAEREEIPARFERKRRFPTIRGAAQLRANVRGTRNLQLHRRRLCGGRCCCLEQDLQLGRHIRDDWHAEPLERA